MAKEFQDANNPLLQWLERMQKKLKDMETIPTDEEKIQRKIQEHDVSRVLSIIRSRRQSNPS